MVLRRVRITCLGVERIFLGRFLEGVKGAAGQSFGGVGNGRVIAVIGKGSWDVNSITGGIMTTDPVCGMKIDEKNSEFNTQFAGKKYSFCSENCKKEFEADPDEFVETAAA